MRKFCTLLKVIVLLSAVLLMQPILQAEDSKVPKGHFIISDSSIDEGHTGVVVFATKMGFVVVWSDDHNIKMQFFKKTGKKVGFPTIIHQNTAHKIYSLEGVWMGKLGAIVWAQDTGLGISIWGKILNKKGGVQVAPTNPLTHGFGSSTRKFGSPTVSWNGKNLLIAFMETDKGNDIYCGKFTSKLARRGTFKKVKNGKDGTPNNLGAFPHTKGWILSWTEEKSAGKPSLIQDKGSTSNPWFSFRKQSNARGKSFRGWSTLAVKLFIYKCFAWQGLNGQIVWLTTGLDESRRSAKPWAMRYYAGNSRGQYNDSSRTTITWLDLLDVRNGRIVIGPSGYAHWIHFWRAVSTVFPNLWILFYVDGEAWIPTDFGTCKCNIVLYAAYAHFLSRLRSLVVYSGRDQSRESVSHVYGRFVNHPPIRR